ncbi:uncharacterized protein LOC134259831 [Saccostrea cucullata]|uniref:uncharacterized protein LOC134259831 n=1 Tax=Saccostrea cuccullata TaxID=36930 RepID=UPI002ED19F11
MDGHAKTGSAAYCCVPLCSEDSRRGTATSFHSFPKDPSARKEWIIKIRRDEGPDFHISKSTYVCSKHFKEDDIVKTLTGLRKLKKGTVPSIFPWTKIAPSRKPPKKREGPPQEETSVIKKQKTSSSISLDTDQHSSTASCAIDTPTDMPSEEHDYCRQAPSLEEDLEAMKIHISELEERVQHLEKKVEKFGIERFSKDPNLINFYTGFSTYDIFCAVYNVVEPTASNMIRWSQVQRNKNIVCNPFREESLSIVDQFFMFLCRIRQGFFEEDLAQRFCVSQSTVSRIIITWSNYLYCVLGCLPIWPDLDIVKQNMPECFKTTFPNTRVILDCTEIRVQTPSAKVLNSQSYSNYKSHTTFKGLIGITPHGAVCFVSRLFTGNISDKDVTQRSGILDLLEQGDDVMVDKGFLIQDLLDSVGAHLIIPPFLGSKVKFSKDEVSKTQQIARLRIHVERAIRRCKEYHIFDNVLPLSVAGTVNQIWSVCCLLTNFKEKLF